MSETVRELLALQDREGWLSPESLKALAERLRTPLHRLESVSTFYTHFEREPPKGTVVEVCRDLSCRMAGGVAACAAARAWAQRRGGVEIREVSCLGRCDVAPAASVGGVCIDASDEVLLNDAAAAAETEVPEAGERRDKGGGPGDANAGRPGSAFRRPGLWPAVDPYQPGAAPLPTGTDPPGERLSAPYSVLRAALERSADDLIDEIEAAGLRGMGGAGFPTARKWSLVRAAEGATKTVICNADESEPGTFKDREILFDLPHLVIEGILLAGLCIGAERGTVFIRHEYGPERQRLEAAIEAAREVGALGARIFGSDFSFELDVFVSPGGYILGEETALLECMEGRRGEPRNKPPFPGVSGLHGQPTLINNVETLMHTVGILHWGASWWHGQGRDGFAGHKFVSTSGDVLRPGVELFSMGATIGEILEAHGGMRDGGEPLAVAPGGASSSFLGPEALSVPLDFDRLVEAGSMLGSGAVVFVESGRDLIDVGLSITRFFRNESCGKCVPCRVGSEKAVRLIEQAGGLDARVETTLQGLHDTMKQTSICGLGQVALAPLLSIADRFPETVRPVSAPSSTGEDS